MIRNYNKFLRKRKNIRNVIKFHAPFERIKETCQAIPEIALFKAIIIQAIIDSTGRVDMEGRNRASRARKWIFGQNEEFKIICSYAGASPRNVKKRTKQAIDLVHSS